MSHLPLRVTFSAMFHHAFPCGASLCTFAFSDDFADDIKLPGSPEKEAARHTGHFLPIKSIVARVQEFSGHLTSCVTGLRCCLMANKHHSRLVLADNQAKEDTSTPSVLRKRCEHHYRCTICWLVNCQGHAVRVTPRQSESIEVLGHPDSDNILRN